MSIRRTLGISTLLAAALVIGMASLTFDRWGHRLEALLWPPTMDERGFPAYELVSETRVSPYPDAASVRLFVESDEDMEIYGFIEPEGRLLSAAERRAFEATLSKLSDRHGAMNACFIPHHHFRYYDAGGEEVGVIDVCFCCQGAQATPELFPQQGRLFLRRHSNRLTFDRERLGAFIEGLGLPVDVWCRETAEAA